MKTKLYLTFFLVFQAFIGLAQPGDIDITFNSSGIGAWGDGPIPPVPTDATHKGKDAVVYNSRVYQTEDGNKDKIIIVGRFWSYNGIATRYIGRVNADGSADPTFVGPSFPAGQYIYNVEIMPDNKILIMGGFSLSFGGVNYRNVMRLMPNGAPDPTFGTGATRGANGTVHAFAIQTDGKIILGGNFSSYNATTCKNVIRVDANGAIETLFNSAAGDFTGSNTDIRSLAMQVDKIIVGGYFTGYSGGYTRNKILRLNSDGSFDSTFNSSHGGTLGSATTGAYGGGGEGAIYDLFVLPPGPAITSNRIYAVGKFESYNGADKRSIIRLTANGDYDTTFNNGTSFPFQGVNGGDLANSGYCAFSIKEQPDGKLLIGGNFVKYNNITIPKGIVRINADGSRDPDFITGSGFVGGTNVYQGKSVVRDILMQSDGKIIVGGDFDTYNTTNRRMLARIRTRECIKAGVFNWGTWSGDGIPLDNTYYMAVKGGTLEIPTGTHMVACELEVKSGATLIIRPGASLTVNGIVMNNGTFTIDNTGALVQVKEDTKNADLGAGVFTMKRDTSPLKPYDYVYWSSPVENLTIHDLSPLTRYDKYFKYSPSINNWVEIPLGNEVMVDGKGYIARAPHNQHSSGTQPQKVGFVGRPRNGLITLPIENALGNLNLVGNPYPSAIDAYTFLNDPDNNTKIGGAIYLWSHATPISSSNAGDYQYNYSESDYITYNSLGSTLTNPTGVLFAGKVGAGQGFFIEALSNTNVTFKNTMRLTGDNNQFYKNSQQQTSSQAPSRLWIDFYNAQGAYKQALVGFTEKATMGMDRAYDAISMSGTVDFYSLVGNNALTIQGRPLPLDRNQVVPMGYMTPTAGTFKIALNQFDGLFNEQDVYLIDHAAKSNTVINLKSGSYTFNTLAGTFNNRFELRFTNPTLRTIDALASSNSTIVSSKSNIVNVAAEESIDSITVYDLTGKVLYNKQGIDALSFASDQLNATQQVVMVVVKFTNNQTITKKVMLQ